MEPGVPTEENSNFLIVFLLGKTSCSIFFLFFSLGDSQLHFLNVFLFGDSRLRLLIIFLFGWSKLHFLIHLLHINPGIREGSFEFLTRLVQSNTFEKGSTTLCARGSLSTKGRTCNYHSTSNLVPVPNCQAVFIQILFLSALARENARKLDCGTGKELDMSGL